MMEGGDKNEIGENGSNLSSGQNVRISIQEVFIVMMIYYYLMIYLVY